jgi:hypothetical protein
MVEPDRAVGPRQGTRNFDAGTIFLRCLSARFVMETGPSMLPGAWFDPPLAGRVTWGSPGTPVQLNRGLMQVRPVAWMSSKLAVVQVSEAHSCHLCLALNVCDD